MNKRVLILLFVVVGLATQFGFAQANSGQGNVNLQLSLGNENGLTDFGVGIQIVVLMTILTLAPTIILLMTSFLRIIIVLGFVRQALGTMSTPSNQVLVGLALFLSFFVMAPVFNRIYENTYLPYQAKEITSSDALDQATYEMKDFMIRQTDPKDLEFFLSISQQGATALADIPLTIALPSFVLSEIRTAFQMGVLIFIPFLVIDFVVASSLMSLGMMMMPPVMIAMPFKLLIFVIVDGWGLILQSLVRSFS